MHLKWNLILVFKDSVLINLSHLGDYLSEDLTISLLHSNRCSPLKLFASCVQGRAFFNDHYFGKRIRRLLEYCGGEILLLFLGEFMLYSLSTIAAYFDLYCNNNYSIILKLFFLQSSALPSSRGLSWRLIFEHLDTLFLLLF